MDTVSLRGEPNPVRSRWVIRPRLDRERFFGFDAFEFIIGVVAVIRVGIGGDDLEVAAWGRLLLASHGRRKEGYQCARRVERPYGLPRLVDFDPANCQFGLFVEYVDDENNLAGAVESLAGVQSNQQPLA